MDFMATVGRLLAISITAAACVAAAAPPAPPVRVGVLSGHDPSKFRNSTCVAGDSAAQAQCNLAVFEASVCDDRERDRRFYPLSCRLPIT